MDHKLLNRLKLIGVFCHVVELGSMKEAAKRLKISAPAVSQFINQLESELDITLLYRSTRKISTSVAGEKYYQQGKKMLLAAEATEDIINQDKTILSGELRIALPVGLAAKPIATALYGVLDEHKDLNLTVMASDSNIDLIGERIDIAIDCGQPENTDYIYHFLGHCNKQIYASPVYLNKFGIPMHPKELLLHTWLGLDLGLGLKESRGVLSCVDIVKENSSRFQFTPNLRLKFNDLNSLVNHVQLGFGLAILPSLEVEHLKNSGDLIPVLPDWQFDKHDIYALTRSRKKSFKVKVALNAMKEYFGAVVN